VSKVANFQLPRLHLTYTPPAFGASVEVTLFEFCQDFDASGRMPQSDQRPRSLLPLTMLTLGLSPSHRFFAELWNALLSGSSCTLQSSSHPYRCHFSINTLSVLQDPPPLHLSLYYRQSPIFWQLTHLSLLLHSTFPRPLILLNTMHYLARWPCWISQTQSIIGSWTSLLTANTAPYIKDWHHQWWISQPA